MPTLTWIGKDKVVNHHQEAPYRVLDIGTDFGAMMPRMRRRPAAGTKSFTATISKP